MMAEAKAKSKLSLKTSINLELTEAEAAALNVMTCYGIKSFLDGYRKHLGSFYIAPHEQGLTSLFETIKGSLPQELKRLRDYKSAIASVEAEYTK